MGDKLRDIISRLSTVTNMDLVDIYDQSKSAKSSDPIEEHRKEVLEHREKLPNRVAKRAYDKALKVRPKLDNKEKKRNRSNDSRRLSKLQKILDEQYPPGAVPVVIGSALYKQTKHIVADSTGDAARLYSRMCKHKIAVTGIKRIALATDKDGNNKYSFSGNDRGAVRARAILALGLLLVGLSKRTGRRGDRWNRLVRGLSQKILIEAISHPAKDAKLISYSAFNGTHDKDAPSDCVDGSVGYLRALKNGKFCYTRQAHWKVGGEPLSRGWGDIQPNEVAPVLIDGIWKVSFCRYWIVTDMFNAPKDAAARAQLWVDYLGAHLPEPHEQPDRASRGQLQSISTVISPAPS